MKTITVTVKGLRDGIYTAGTRVMLRQIRALGATVELASTGRVTLTTSTGARLVYVLDLDQDLVNPSAEVQAQLSAAESPLSRALGDLRSELTAQAVAS